MGNWQLEVFKMAVYVSFPIMMFHYFNQPENFEEQIAQMARLTTSPTEEEDRKLIKEAIKTLKEREEARQLKLLEENQNQKQ